MPEQLPVSQQRRYKIALLCLEHAVHVGTGNPEALAGIDGWRRKTSGMRLSDVLTALYPYRSPIGFGMAEYQREWKALFDNQNAQLADLADENLKLAAEKNALEEQLRLASKTSPKQPRRARHKPANTGKPTTPREARKSTKRGQEWTDEEVDYLVRIHMADVRRSNPLLAAMCTKEFGRLISYPGICGKLDRLRIKGRIPEYRPGREPKKRRRSTS